MQRTQVAGLSPKTIMCENWEWETGFVLVNEITLRAPRPIETVHGTSPRMHIKNGNWTAMTRFVHIFFQRIGQQLLETIFVRFTFFFSLVQFVAERQHLSIFYVKTCAIGLWNLRNWYACIWRLFHWISIDFYQSNNNQRDLIKFVRSAWYVWNNWKHFGELNLDHVDIDESHSSARFNIFPFATILWPMTWSLLILCLIQWKR